MVQVPARLSGTGREVGRVSNGNLGDVHAETYFGSDHNLSNFYQPISVSVNPNPPAIARRTAQQARQSAKRPQPQPSPPSPSPPVSAKPASPDRPDQGQPSPVRPIPEVSKYETRPKRFAQQLCSKLAHQTPLTISTVCFQATTTHRSYPRTGTAGYLHIRRLGSN